MAGQRQDVIIRAESQEVDANQRAAAVDEAGLCGAVFEGLARNFVVVGFVGLAQVGCVGVGDRSLLSHTVQGGRSVKPAREGNANLLADGQGFENYGHTRNLGVHLASG